MPHMVVFRTKEGKPGYHWADTLDDAVRFVEHLRNNEQVDDSKVYRMSEVPIEFKVLYKVEVGAAGDSPSTPAPSGSTGGAGASGSDTEFSGPGRESASVPQAATADSRGSSSNNAGSMTVVSSAESSPAAQAGGRFGLFSRA